MPSLTLKDVLSYAERSSGDAGRDLVETLTSEIYAPAPDELRVPIRAFYSIQALGTCLGLLIIAIRCRRGDRWLYRFQETPYGFILVPNTMLNFVIWSVIFMAFSISFNEVKSLRHGSIIAGAWLSRAYFIPLFLASWHVCMGTWVTFLLQAMRMTRIKLSHAPLILNSVFVSAIVVCIVSVFAAGAVGIHRVSGGLQAFRDLRARFDKVWATGASTTSASDIQVAIPDVQQYLDRITQGLWRAEVRWEICAAFAMLCAVTMIVGCAWHALILSRQMSAFDRQFGPPSGSATSGRGGQRQRSTPPQQQMASTTSQRGSTTARATTTLDAPPSPSLSVAASARMSMRRTLRNVLVMGLLLCLSMIAFIICCFMGNANDKRSPIFEMSSADQAHAKVLAGLGVLEVFILSFILYMTLTTPGAGSSSKSYPGQSKSGSGGQVGRFVVPNMTNPLGTRATSTSERWKLQDEEMQMSTLNSHRTAYQVTVQQEVCVTLDTFDTKDGSSATCHDDSPNGSKTSVQ